MINITCFKCQHQWSYEGVLGRRDDCPSCSWDAHVCKNCQHYAPNFHHECRENQADYVQEKERSNYCDYFLANGQKGPGTSEADSAKAKLAGMFGGGSENGEKPKSKMEEELNKFFKK